MAKKKLPVSIFEIVWYSICALVIIWGLVYVILSLVDKYNNLSGLHTFANNFKITFGLSLYFWGLIIISIGIVAGVAVMIIYAKTFDRAADREQRRSARLSVLNKKEDKVVSEQQPEVVEDKPVEDTSVVEETSDPVEEKPAEEALVEEAPVTEEKPAEDNVESANEEKAE